MNVIPTIRIARREDLPAIVKLLADDNLGAHREVVSASLNPAYENAFNAIDSDVNNELIVMCDSERVIGTLQITYIPNITFTGGWRAQVEGVRIDADYQGHGLGRKLFAWVFERARTRGCQMLQLTMNKTRTASHKFYASLGFAATHEGFKLIL
ncbi:MAG: GNAT family N-acetyltransferase [Arenicellales bacterium WSBS_2016_MAG_OTU3]